MTTTSAAMALEPVIKQPGSGATQREIRQCVDSALKMHRYVAAEEFLRQLLEKGAADHGLHHNLGVCLANQGKLGAAIEHFQLAIEFRSDAVDTLNNLAMAYMQADQFDRATTVLREVVRMEPDSVRARQQLGKALYKQRHFYEAVEQYEVALTITPDAAELHHELGRVQADMGRGRDAESHFREALQLDRDFAEAFSDLGSVLETQGKHEEAVVARREAVRLRPGSEEAHNNLGVALAGQRRFADAIESYRRALAMNGRSAHVFNNLGNALRAEGCVDEAVSCLKQAIHLSPGYAEAFNNLGIALVQQGRVEEALTHYDHALQLRPDYPEAHLNRALSQLACGDFHRGWTDYEWRWKGKNLFLRSYRQPRWNGASLQGRSIFLYAEQGLGDTIQFIRYARLLKRQGARVYVEVQPPLTRLVKSCREIDVVVAPGKKPPPFDFHCPILGLPGVFQTTLDTIPAEVPYFDVDRALVDRWRSFFASYDGFKVGICWRGNPQHRGDRWRSIPLQYFEPLARIPGVQLFSIQKDNRRDELELLSNNGAIVDLDDQLNDFMDTAAAMRSLDLIIACDSSPAHLAGALWVPVWVALPLAADWRWLRHRTDSPWYPSLRLFRQKAAGDWEGVFETMSVELRRQVDSRLQNTRLQGTLDINPDEEYKRALQLTEGGRLAEAQLSFERAVAARPEFLAAHHNLGVVLAMQRQLSRAVLAFQRALQLEPTAKDTHANLGLAYLERRQVDAAVFHLREALRGGHTADTHSNLGVALMQQGKPEEAEKYYREALYLKPDYVEAHLNLSRALLAQGRFRESWQEAEWRWKRAGCQARAFRKPRWAGEALRGQRLLLYAEDEVSDTLQYARYAAVAKERGATVVLECPRPLRKVLRTTPGIDEIVAVGDPLPAFDLHAPLLSVPGLVGHDREQVPRGTPYVFAAPELVEHWRERFRPFSGFKIGLAWQAIRLGVADESRSIPLEDFEPLSRVDGVHLIGLQAHAGASERVGCRRTFDMLPFSSAGTSDKVDEIAGQIANLDLVITSDTWIGHLAGAMGAPVWVVLPFSCDARWLSAHPECPWYPSMRLWRASQSEIWSSIFDRIADELDRNSLETRLARTSMDETKWRHRTGIAEIQRGRFKSAIAHFEHAVQTCPASAAAHNGLGVALARQGQKQRAISCFTKALDLEPDFGEAAANAGLAYLELGQHSDAEPHLRKAVRLRPDSAQDHFHLGLALFRNGDRGQAIELYRQAIHLKPDFATAHFQLAEALRHEQQLEAARLCYLEALRLDPQQADWQCGFGDVLLRLGEPEGAAAAYGEAIRLSPDHFAAHHNLAIVLADLDRPEAAAATAQRAVYLQPSNALAHRNLGMVLLLKGDFERGWTEYEWRSRNQCASKGRRAPRWDGRQANGRTILLTSEQGLGDTIQFVRYAKLVKQRGARVIVQCHRSLLKVLMACPDVDAVLSADCDLPPHDLQVPLMSLPLVFGTQLETIPRVVPYLAADQQLVDRWKKRLTTGAKIRVGIAWQGSQATGGDRNRSIPFRWFSDLAKLPGVQLFSLQKGFGREQFLEQPGCFEDLADSLVDLSDTAAVMMNLDLIISCDSLPAHLAGALGRPTWLPLCCANDWRWLRGRQDSPWYPTVQLFRQTRRNDWADVFERIAEQLRNWISSMAISSAQSPGKG